MDLDIRPVEPVDASALARFHAGLSAETTRLRYFTYHPRLSKRELAHFTCVDHHDREALVAWVGDDIVGIGRYERTTPTEAEVAFVVTDEWQRHGIATRLLTMLAERAQSEGIERLEADTLGENHAMAAVFEQSGFAPHHNFGGGVAHYVMAIGSPRRAT